MSGVYEKRRAWEEILVAFIAVVIGIYSELPAFQNPYVIVDDFRQHLYWMRQFRDGALFRNDLFTEYARHYQPWGLIAFYYLVSPLIDPLAMSKILPVILLALSSLYLFKLVRHLANTYSGFLAAFLFMTTFTYVDRIAGGLPRSFAFPLLIVFLYYLTRKDYLKTSLVLVLQCLFYPVLFLTSALTYLLMFFKILDRKIKFDCSFRKAVFFFLGVLLSGSLLYGKYVLATRSLIGTLVTRQQMIHHPEYYEFGRYQLLPTAPLLQEIGKNIRKGLFTKESIRKNPVFDYLKTPRLKDPFSLAVVCFLLWGLWKMKGFIPQEFLSLFLAGVFLYRLSDLLLMKLFVPTRYLEYSIPLITLILFAVAVGKGVERIQRAPLRKLFQIAGTALLVFLNFNVNAKATFIDMSYGADLYGYLSTLPKDTLIAAHPALADGIPTFAKRKVFLQLELSHPFFDRYWKVIKKRTFDFFDAYYAEDPASLYQFSKGNQIEYWVVDQRDFSEETLRKKKIYFEPFDTVIKRRIGKRNDFALKHIPESAKLFSKEGFFVIHRESLRPVPLLSRITPVDREDVAGD